MIPIPGGDAGVGFDDLRFSATLGRVIVPAGGTGSLVLVEPGEWTITRFGGFSEPKAFGGGHDDGVTSADEGRGFLFVTDRTARRLSWSTRGRPRRFGGEACCRPGLRPLRRADGRGLGHRARQGAHRDLSARGQSAEAGARRLHRGRRRPGVARRRRRARPGVRPPLERQDGRPQYEEPGHRGRPGRTAARARAASPSTPSATSSSSGAPRAAAWCSTRSRAGSWARSDVGNGIDIIDYNPRLPISICRRQERHPRHRRRSCRPAAVPVVGEVPTAKGGHCVVADASERVYVCDPTAGRILVLRDAAVAALGRRSHSSSALC